jgi:hypothetical protein
MAVKMAQNAIEELDQLDQLEQEIQKSCEKSG